MSIYKKTEYAEFVILAIFNSNHLNAFATYFFVPFSLAKNEQ